MICKIRVALLGYKRGHKFQPILAGRTKHSVALVCLRCGENGFQL